MKVEKLLDFVNKIIEIEINILIINNKIKCNDQKSGYGLSSV